MSFIIKLMNDTIVATLPDPQEIDDSDFAFTIFRWGDKIRFLLPALRQYEAVNFEQYRNRDGVFEIYGDPGIKLVKFEFDEVNESTLATNNLVLKGAYVIAQASSVSGRRTIGLILYYATHLLERSTGVEEVAV